MNLARAPLPPSLTERSRELFLRYITALLLFLAMSVAASGAATDARTKPEYQPALWPEELRK